MQRLAVVAVLVLIALAITPTGSPANHCQYGVVRGFAALRSNPPYLVGTIPNEWASSKKWFTRRYNCLGTGVAVRRVDVGTYDIMFRGQRPKVILVSAISDSGVTASARPFGDFIRIALRGPLGGDDVAARRDIPFAIAIY